ncbi:unnamed protein product, partial [marine sediment metagenome]
DPIYLNIPEGGYTLEYGQNLLLEGCVRDNDNYLVEDRIYQYNYTEAQDGRTVYTLDIISPLGDPNFISTEEFSIYYIDIFDLPRDSCHCLLHNPLIINSVHILRYIRLQECSDKLD